MLERSSCGGTSPTSPGGPQASAGPLALHAATKSRREAPRHSRPPEALAWPRGRPRTGRGKRVPGK
eukprot:1349433-Pyramimonas_sp.AAC.1